MVVLRIESWCHLNRLSLITETQLLRKWIWVWGLPQKSKLGESWIFQRAKLLMLLREKIGAFSRNWKYSPVECFVLLSCSLISLFRSEFRCQELIWQSLHLLIFSRYCHFECFSCQLFQKVLSYFDFSKT